MSTPVISSGSFLDRVPLRELFAFSSVAAVPYYVRHFLLVHGLSEATAILDKLPNSRKNDIESFLLPHLLLAEYSSSRVEYRGKEAVLTWVLSWLENLHSEIVAGAATHDTFINSKRAALLFAVLAQHSPIQFHTAAETKEVSRESLVAFSYDATKMSGDVDFRALISDRFYAPAKVDLHKAMTLCLSAQALFTSANPTSTVATRACILRGAALKYRSFCALTLEGAGLDVDPVRSARLAGEAVALAHFGRELFATSCKLESEATPVLSAFDDYGKASVFLRTAEHLVSSVRRIEAEASHALVYRAAVRSYKRGLEYADAAISKDDDRERKAKWEAVAHDLLTRAENVQMMAQACKGETVEDPDPPGGGGPDSDPFQTIGHGPSGEEQLPGFDGSGAQEQRGFADGGNGVTADAPPVAPPSIPWSAFECAICVETLTDPVTAACAHNFCISCLRDWHGSSPTPTCPTCRAPLGDASRFLVNTGLRDMIAAVLATSPNAQSHPR